MRPHIRSTDYSRSSKRRAEKDANTAMTVSLEQSMRIEELERLLANECGRSAFYARECNKLRKHVQLLETRASRVPDEMNKCECNAKDPRPSHSSRTGFVCYNCGGECGNV